MVERNITLDYFKLVLSILVVLIHVQPLVMSHLEISNFISNGLCRIAVPSFFILNGYFIGDKVSNKLYIKKYITRLVVLLLIWDCIYFYTIDPNNFTGYRLLKVLLDMFIGIYHLWYISALIGSIFLFYFVQKIFKNIYILLFISIILFTLGFFIQNFFLSYGNAFLPVSLRPLFINIYRNALFLALPFFILGFLIYQIRDKIKTQNKEKMLFVFFILSLLIFLFEVYISEMPKASKDFYFSLFFTCPMLVIIVLKYSKYTVSSDFISQLSQSIYFIHVLVIYILFESLFRNNYDNNKLILIPLILFLSALLSVGIIQLNKKIKIFL